MSKCREEFLRWLKTATLKVARAPDGGCYWTDIEHERSLWQAARNARGKADAEICREQRADTDDEDAIGWNTACTECAEAIEQ